MNIFVAKMSSTTTSEDLQALFGAYGTVTSAKVIIDRETGNSKCFGFVEMEDDTEGNNAINGLNGTEVQGRMIVVKVALPKEEMGERRSFRPRSEGGFNRGGGYERRGGYGNREGGSYERRGGYSNRGGYDRSNSGYERRNYSNPAQTEDDNQTENY